MTILRRKFLEGVAASASLGFGGFQGLQGASPVAHGRNGSASSPEGGAREGEIGPDPVFEKPAPITMAELARQAIKGVAAIEVSDYAPGHYHGDLSPSPPHADMNPKKATMVVWEHLPQRFVFCHEASYDPIMELPNGVALCNQFFEGNDGWAELFNSNGRKERNSFVDIVRSGPEHVWVRWNYFCVNKDDDSHPAIRGTEDYVAYTHGLVWRRLTYTSLMPERFEGYSWQPIDFFAIAPTGTTWKDLFPRDEMHGDYHVASALDAYSDRRYDVFWDDAGKPRRVGDKDLLLSISHSPGFAMVMPFKTGHLFTVLGNASGFPSKKSQIVDHSFDDTGGWGWRSARWDHWPVGWLNSQANDYKPGSPYPYHFGPLSHYIVNKPIEDAKRDFPIEARDMELNRWTERHVYYTLMGVSDDLESVRRLARKWLDKGVGCARPTSIAEL